MKYGYIKSQLQEKGFKLEFIQTDYILDALSFINEDINGEIFVSFGNIEDINGEKLVEGMYIDYVSDMLDNIEVASIQFHINKSISSTNTTLNIWGENEKNNIYLQKDTIDKYFDKVLGIVSNPYSIISFASEYATEVLKFNQSIERLLPIISKYPSLHFTSLKTSGDENCLYTDIQHHLYYGSEKFDCIVFEYKVILNEINFFKYSYHDSEKIDINISLEEFEEIIVSYINKLEKNKELYREGRAALQQKENETSTKD